MQKIKLEKERCEKLGLKIFLFGDNWNNPENDRKPEKEIKQAIEQYVVLFS